MKETINPTSECVDKANVFVGKTEDSYVMKLFEWKAMAEKKAKDCGCPNCKKELVSAEAVIARELKRLQPHPWRKHR